MNNLHGFDSQNLILPDFVSSFKGLKSRFSKHKSLYEECDNYGRTIQRDYLSRLRRATEDSYFLISMYDFVSLKVLAAVLNGSTGAVFKSLMPRLKYESDTFSASHYSYKDEDSSFLRCSSELLKEGFDVSLKGLKGRRVIQLSWSIKHPKIYRHNPLYTLD